MPTICWPVQSANDVTLRYVDQREGVPVLLVGDFTERVEMQTGTFDALVDSGCRVVAYDNRGHGKR